MRRHVWIGAFLIVLSARDLALGQQPRCCEPPESCFLKRWHPVGGWDPYGGCLLHWWEPHCFPCGGAPDDYCRKKLPRVCWPPYPPYYTWGPPEICCPQGKCSRPCNRPQ